MASAGAVFRRGALMGAGGLALLACLVVCLSGCPFDAVSPARQDDLALARTAVRDRDIGDAEMYFERYLRKNPQGEQRWEVWQSLLEIALDIRHDKGSAREYLEIMLEEFGGDNERRREIQLTLASLAGEMRSYERAVSLWEAVSADPATPQETLAEVYRELSRAYLRRLEFTLSKEVLDRCLQLNVAGETKGRCLYALAEAHMLTDELGLAEEALRSMLELGTTDAAQRVEATFMLADVLEQRDRFGEAEELFDSIRDTYPNTRVIEVRLSALRNKAGTRKSVK